MTSFIQLFFLNKEILFDTHERSYISVHLLKSYYELSLLSRELPWNIAKCPKNIPKLYICFSFLKCEYVLLGNELVNKGTHNIRYIYDV